MIWKLLSTTFFILLSIQNTYAYKTISYQPIVKYNYSKSHYLVSLPVNKNSWNGFTAVFDSKTHQSTFKIPRYFHDGLIFLSNDGTKLIHFDSKKDSLDKHLTLFFHLYDQNGESKSIIFFDEKEKAHLWEGIHDIRQEKNQLIIIAKDSSYILSEDNLRVSTVKNGKIGDYMANLSNGFLDNDSVFSISRLKINGVPIIDTLLIDLNMQMLTKENFVKTKMTYILQFENYINANDNTFRFNEFQLSNGNYRMEDRQVTGQLKAKMINLLDTYIESSDIIPDGVDFWYFTGNFMFIEN